MWLWKDWKYRTFVSKSGTDVGVDLIGEEKNGDLCAIQCKCYADDGSISYDHLSTFFGTLGLMKAKFKKKINSILVYTGDRTSPQADKAISAHDCHILGQDELRNSSIDWGAFPKLRTRRPKSLRPHQIVALEAVTRGLDNADRGKMIMACGTGKTLTSLRIAEKYAGPGKAVLYLVPSISLIHQTMREWSENAKIDHHYEVVCSDKTVGNDEDGDISELAFPPTTDAKTLQERFRRRSKDAMGVIFSTYQSIDVASKAIMKPFDLVLCDEAHRTTGVEKEKTDLTHFTRVHHDRHVKARKRLYMTATPRVYGEAVKTKANVHSMDDLGIYGEDLYNYSFSDAVNDGQLADFKVRIPVIPEEDLRRYTDESIEMTNDDGTIDERVLLAAVWHGLNYSNDRRQPLLQRVIAFSNKIAASKQFAGPYRGDAPTQDEEVYVKRQEKAEDEDRIEADRSFASTVTKYEKTSEARTGNTVSVRHIDGAMRASIRGNKLRWLKDSSQEPNECRILTNARCLSEGVDVPSLDGIVFLQPRKSKTDVVQAVGRVMRRTEGKEYGYVILPVVIPNGMTFDDALHDNRAWKTVWQVLSALRSHNPNFANEINRVNLDRGQGGGPPGLENVEIIWMGSHHNLEVEHEMFGKLVTKMVEKVGDRAYFDDRSRDLGRKSREIREIVKESYRSENKKITGAVNSLRDGLCGVLHDSVDEDTTISILAQHHSLKQVFDALFPKEFRLANPIADALDEAISKIGLQRELESFESFYEEVRTEAAKFEHGEGKQNYIKKIYGNFMKGFDPARQKSIGIVYTPDEVIDFILHSVQHILKTEFGKSYESNDVKIFDPFTGTGAFIARLLESGMISRGLEKKYRNDIWANEISLLAFYVAAVNIEFTYQKVSKKNIPFSTINFTDTLNQNSRYRLDARHRRRATKLDGSMEALRLNLEAENLQSICAILANPPYSMGDQKPDTKVKRMVYPDLDERIMRTFGSRARTNNKKQLRDSYIRSIRWASDRIDDSGIVAFVTNASFLRSDVGAGVRAALAEEFNQIWLFDLRGDAQTQGEQRKREGDNVFDQGSKTPVVIIFLVRIPDKRGCVIRYKDIGDFLTREEKLDIIRKAKSIAGIKGWRVITPDRRHDWLDQGLEEFSEHIPMGSKGTKAGRDNSAIFRLYSSGVKTHRDVWIYNSDKTVLIENMKKHTTYCKKHGPNRPQNVDPKQAKWDSELSKKLKRYGTELTFDEDRIRMSLHRPFFKQYMYFDRIFNAMQYRIPEFFPEMDSENLTICVPYKSKGEFSVFISNITPDIQLNFNGQCFPFHTYEYGKKNENIIDTVHRRFQRHYKNDEIAKMDIFEYVYGILHHAGYRKKYGNNLARELPRIPLAPDFWAFRNAGRELMDLHLHYDTGTMHDMGKPKSVPGKFTKLAFGRKGRTLDKSVICNYKTVIFDHVPDIGYRVNGRTPVEWMVDRYNKTQDKESGIINDPLESMTGRQVVDLLCRLVHVGVDSDRIISKLPSMFELDVRQQRNIDSY